MVRSSGLSDQLFTASKTTFACHIPSRTCIGLSLGRPPVALLRWLLKMFATKRQPSQGPRRCFKYAQRNLTLSGGRHSLTNASIGRAGCANASVGRQSLTNASWQTDNSGTCGLGHRSWTVGARGGSPSNHMRLSGACYAIEGPAETRRKILFCILSLRRCFEMWQYICIFILPPVTPHLPESL